MVDLVRHGRAQVAEWIVAQASQMDDGVAARQILPINVSHILW
jgi:hypothetical protein